MKLLRSWIEDYVDLSGISNEELQERITTRIAEVDEGLVIGSNLENAKVVKVAEVKQHPERSGLSVCKLEDGTQVVCGADNVREGLKTVWLKPGSKFGDITVGERDFAGFKSSGLLLSEAELEVGPGKGGIIELSEDVNSLTDVFGDPDFLIDIDNKSLTHRPDLWCHYGFAREIAGVFELELKSDFRLPDLPVKEQTPVVTIENDKDCTRFLAVKISGLSVAQSPGWMKRRLFSVGAGVRNSLVDLSNYVMLDIGQPNHLYDAAKLKDNSLSVSSGGKLTALDEETYELSDDDLVIKNAGSVVGIAGVMGGLESSVTEGTTSVILEAANFDAVKVRKTSKKLGLRTDASNRFEKRLSPELPELCIKRFLQLVEAPGVTVSEVADAGSYEAKPIEIKLDHQWINSRLGTELSPAKINSLLESVGFEIKGDRVVVPFYRSTGDVSIEEDILEEVGRLSGYENILPTAPDTSVTPVAKNEYAGFEESLRDYLAGRGLNEIELYSSISPQYQARLGYSESAINLKNAVDSTENQLRLSLVPGMLKALENNSKHFHSFGLFELGRSYAREGASCKERRVLCIGIKPGKSVTDPEAGEGEAVFLVSKLCRELLAETDIEIIPEARLAWQHSYRGGTILVNGAVVGVFGEVHPEISDGRFVLAELDLEVAFSNRTKDTYTEVRKFPTSFFEVSVVVPEKTYFSELVKVVSKGGHSEHLEEVKFVSSYSGDSVKQGSKSVSVQLVFANKDRTIERSELEDFRSSVIRAIETSEFEFRA